MNLRVPVLNTVSKEEKKITVSHDWWPQQSLARDHVQHTPLYLCALSVETTHSLRSDSVIGGARKFQRGAVTW